MLPAMVLGLAEVSSWKWITAAGERTMAMAIVSPRARPRPSMQADTMPGVPKGSTACLIISQRNVQRAKTANFRSNSRS